MAVILRKFLPCFFPKNERDGDENSRKTSATKRKGSATTGATSHDPRPPSHPLASSNPSSRGRDESGTSQATTKSHSVGSSSKPESADPDEITPVQNTQQQRHQNLMNAADDRRKLFERLRNPRADEAAAEPDGLGLSGG